MGWTALLLAGLCEIGFTTCLQLSDGFRKTWPTLFFVVFTIASFLMMSRALETIPLGTVYAVWTGIGAVGTALVGIVFFRESATPLRLGLLTAVVGLIIGLRLVP
ncbi:QacE family quaternary ammonium compound efflux SMR transporter [Deinococcus aerolatus]|uniref:QacE family quaternary ammonium compound efflux SMR transporter n=1 Tax=Deinococcus aerolatus TaxID=522487 RepID=A0ABQ2G559_9DEIO|nr:multidrug efflux SMR transporter [Deinococcus aerolatus]GGL75518.1 QacE family quaternary ammonium compound efflux SMR transporter [Deinococcus aerolatus]